MKNDTSKLKIIVSLLAMSYWLLAIGVSAQTSPQFLVSWKAYNYTPNFYQGKSFPIYSTPTEISFELLENNKLVNLSNYEIRWYLNNTLFIKGKGLQTISFVPKNQASTNIVIRIAVVNYKGEELNKLIYIPVKNSELILDSPYLTNIVEVGKTYQFKALPFFFNADNANNLFFDWTVNDQPVISDENPDVLNLTISTSTPSGMEININATVKNTLSVLELATKNLKLIVK